MPEASREFLERESESVVQFREQPALFQRRLRLGRLHQPGYDQCICLFTRPAVGRDRVSSQPAQRTSPFVTVDHDKPVCRILHNHNGHLLPHFCERGQKPALLFRADHS